METAESSLEMAKGDEKEHEIDSVKLIVFMILLIFTILSIWAIKHFRIRFIHETGLSIIYGMLIGLVAQYIKDDEKELHVYNQTILDNATTPGDVKLHLYSQEAQNVKNYTCQTDTASLGSKMVFDPEIFFYVLLPPIIFHAGYSMKRRHFFRNFGAIICFAFAGTLISTFTIGGILYGFVQGLPHLPVMAINDTAMFSFKDCLWYGSIISATDPVTVLAIFHDLNVDVDLYALVFGESVLNDAVAITLAKAIETYEPGGADDVAAIFTTIGLFLGIFIGSFFVGLLIGCINALMTKFTKIRDYPLLESSLLILMSYLSYLVAEACLMSGIVAVLFCGIFQAHYTFNNLSEDSRKMTKEVIEILNFITENFVFLYIGVSVFTRRFKANEWNPYFIFGALVAMIVSRAVNIYPLSALLNLGRKNKIKRRFQHMMMFSGLRGAIAFALAIRQAGSALQRDNIFLTTTIVLVIITVIGCGALTLSMLQWLKIRVGVDDPTEGQTIGAASQNDNGVVRSDTQGSSTMTKAERAQVVKVWNRLDNAIFKPMLTNYRVTLSENFPENRCCGVLSRFCTTPEQFQNCARTTGATEDDNDSDADMIIDADELTLNSPVNGQPPPISYTDESGDMKLIDRTSTP